MRFDRWCAIEDDDTISQIGGHDEIVFDNKTCFLAMKNESRATIELHVYRSMKGARLPLDDTSRVQTLFRIEIRRRFIDQVDVSWFAETEAESDTLQFTTG